MDRKAILVDDCTYMDLIARCEIRCVLVVFRLIGFFYSDE